MCDVSNGRAWASASARTLARRLRRERVRSIGASRAQALTVRVSQFRTSLALHWGLCDRIGAHFSQFADALTAAQLARVPLPDLSELTEARDHGDWAKTRLRRALRLRHLCRRPSVLPNWKLFDQGYRTPSSSPRNWKLIGLS